MKDYPKVMKDRFSIPSWFLPEIADRLPIYDGFEGIIQMFSNSDFKSKSCSCSACLVRIKTFVNRTSNMHVDEKRSQLVFSLLPVRA